MKTLMIPHAHRVAACLIVLLFTASAMADVVYITARPTPSGAGRNLDLNSNFEDVYSEDNISLDDTSAASVASGAPPRSGSRYYQFSAPLEDTSVGFTIRPDLGVEGGIYRLDHSLNANAGNVNSNAVFSVSSPNATLSVTETDVFNRTNSNTWRVIGFVTNAPGSANPVIEFRYQSGFISAASPGNRLLVDVFRFSLFEPCLNVPVPTVQGPLSADVPVVTVAGVTNTATAVAVYQDSGAGMVKIGELTEDVVAGVNLVPVSGLVKDAVVSATQTVDGQESCVQASGLAVGGGANPRIRMTLSIRETSSTGPIGTPGSTASANLHFLGATARIGSAPADGLVVYPSNEWQTVTFFADPEIVIGNAPSAAGEVNPFGAYDPNDTVQIQVYAFTNDPVTFITYYSQVGATSATATSNGFFGVDWSWDAVPSAEGYRLLRSLNGSAFNEFQDVWAVNTLFDFGPSGFWQPGSTVTPSTRQNGPSVQWNAAVAGDVGKTNNIGTPWGVLDAIAFAIDDLTDTGPFDIFLDNLQNGDTVWQDFEGFVSGALEPGFRLPRFSGSTSGNLLTAPNVSAASNLAADTGSKSARIRFQWSGTAETRWLRLTTFGVGNPQLDLSQPISMRMLLLPVGSAPVAPPAPSLSIKLVNGEVVLDWEGAHRLQEADEVQGPYTPVVGAPFIAPYTITPEEDQKFYRLVD